MTAVGFSDPRVSVHVQDGNVFLENNKNRFDVIITDSSDSSGKTMYLDKGDSIIIALLGSLFLSLCVHQGLNINFIWP